MIVVRLLGRVALFALTVVLYSLNFYMTKGADVGLVAVNADILQFIATRASSTPDLWVHFKASGLSQVMFALELFIILHVILSSLSWAIASASSPRLPGSFPPAETVSGHGNAHVKSPPAVMNRHSGGMRIGGGGHSQI